MLLFAESSMGEFLLAGSSMKCSDWLRALWVSSDCGEFGDVSFFILSVLPDDGDAHTGSRSEACVSTALVTSTLQKVCSCVQMWASHGCNQ